MAFFWTMWLWIVSFFSLFTFWLSILFVIPLKDYEILWILVPVWMNLFFTDFYQEKRGTDYGSAITNGVAMLWVGVDWIRFLIRALSGRGMTFSKLLSSNILVLKFALSAFVLIIGVIIMIEGIKGIRFVRAVGRVRNTSYLLLVLSPVIYGLAQFSWKYLLAITLFFPVYYFTIELIDRFVPDPKVMGKRD